MKKEKRRPAMHGEAVLDDKTLYGVAHRKRRQDEKMREGFSLSSAPRGGKIALFALLIFTFSLLICSCSSKTAMETGELDRAVREASDYLNENIPVGSTVVILNVKADSQALTKYVLDKLYENTARDARFSAANRDDVEKWGAATSGANEYIQWDNDPIDSFDTGMYGAVFKAQNIIIGMVSKTNDRYRLTIRVLDAQTANVKGVFNYNFTAKKLTDS